MIESIWDENQVKRGLSKEPKLLALPYIRINCGAFQKENFLGPPPRSSESDSLDGVKQVACDIPGR